MHPRRARHRLTRRGARSDDEASLAREAQRRKQFLASAARAIELRGHGTLGEGDARYVSTRPSRRLHYNRVNAGDKKPRYGIFGKKEYRRPSQGFDLPVPGKAVLDLGAHVGFFSLWCLDNGASRIVAVEADPTTAALHTQNCARDDRVQTINAAVVSRENAALEPTATFRRAPRGNTWVRNSRAAAR